uniref:DUF5899 domain-containing protein n=1 Tax=viral metagenome TaxID=1070528 RepID=A0A6C0CMJ3_9ZZZZ
MELAIPIIALSGLYMASSNKKKEEMKQKEGFQNNLSPLPNTNIPDRNYPEEHEVEVAELDRTAKLSTINKYDTPSTYTDKYFTEKVYPETTGVNTFTSMTGENVNSDYFQHNNMTPFFGSKNRSQILEYDSGEGILDNYNGSGTQFINKQEQSPMFSPGENLQYAYGAPNQNDFYQSRVNPSMRMANVKPFESQQVGPGLGLGSSNEGQGGYNSGMAIRDQWMPKNVDQLRTDNNKRSSGIGLLGHEGPAMHRIQTVPTSDNIGRVEKNRVEKTWDMGYGERNFTTVGMETAPASRAIQIDRHVNRPETTTSYVGGAGAQPETYTTGEYMESKHMDLGHVPFGIASATNKQSGNDHEYEIKAKHAYPNNRSVGTQETYFGAFSSAIGAVVAPLIDELRPSRKENTIGSLRPYQNPHTTVSNSYMFNPADRANPTIRQTTEQNKYLPGVNSNQHGGAYQTTDHRAPKQQRDSTSTSYMGNSSAGAGTKEFRPYDAEYRQRNNEIKSSTIKGHMVQGNLKLQNDYMNVRNRDGELKNTRPLSHTTVQAQLVGADGVGLQHSKQMYNSNVQIDRNTPDMLDAFHKNPYTHPLPGSK